MNARHSTKLRSLVAAIACGLLYCTSAVSGERGHGDAYRAIDSNNDGRISPAEHEAHSRMLFSMADADKDGEVTAAEMAGMRMHHDGRGDHGDHGDHMLTADSDSDGRLSRAEFIAAHGGDASRFAAHDANNDGFIGADEMKHHKMSKGKSKQGCCEGGCACCDKMKKAT